jgi:hypothetical protein
MIKALSIVVVLVAYHSGNAIAFQKLTPEQQKDRLKQGGQPVEGIVLDARNQKALKVQLFDAQRNVVTVAAVDVDVLQAPETAQGPGQVAAPTPPLM